MTPFRGPVEIEEHTIEKRRSQGDSIVPLEPHFSRIKGWFFDLRFSEAINILLTIAIAYYAGYAAKQWDVLRRQADDAEAVQGARLAFEDFHSDIIPNQAFAADITLSVTNYGQTVANGVTFGYQWNTAEGALFCLVFLIGCWLLGLALRK